MIALLTAWLLAQSASGIIGRALAASQAQDARNWQYTYREDAEQWDLDAHGRRVNVQRSTYEHIMLEGGEYKKLLLVNGKPLSARAQKKVDAAMETERANRRRHPVSGEFSYSGSLDRLERLFDCRVTGEETVGGHKAWRVEASPKPGYRPANREEEQLLLLRHVFWFNEEDGAEVREEGVFLRGSTSLNVSYTKVGDAWLIDTVTMQGNFGGSETRAYDYKRFVVDSVLNPQ